MIRLGLIGAVKTHAYVFSSIFNGGEEKDWPADAWKPGRITHIDEAKIVRVWGQTKDVAALLAKTCNIPDVVNEPQDVADGVDAVILCDDTSLKHSRYWRHFLERGIPTFIDKPLADNVETVEEIIRFARENDCLLMSTSALRYAAEVPDFKKKVEQIGNIRTGIFTGRPKGRLINYGVHAVELFHSVLGPGVESVHAVGPPDRHVIKINYKDGRVFAFMYCKGLPWEVSLLGETGCAHTAIKDNDYYFYNLMRHFVGMVRTRELPVPLEDTLEIMKTCLAAERSCRTGQEVFL